MAVSIKLDKQNVEDILPLTNMQEGILFHYLSNESSREYCEQLRLNLSGHIDTNIIKKAWNIVIESNEALRTFFRWEKVEKPIQIILKHYETPIREYDFSNCANETKFSLVENIIKKDLEEGIDIRLEPFRITLCRLSEDNCEMIITNHHIIYDGWSNAIVLKEFSEIYNNICNGVKVSKKIKQHFRQFIDCSIKQDTSRQQGFWSDYLGGFDTKTKLKLEGIENKDSIEPGIYRKILSRSFTQKVMDFIKENRITLSTLIYTSWGLLLQKYTYSNDVVFGTTTSGRSAKVNGIEEMVGLFINTIPLRIKCNSDDTILQLLHNVEVDLREREQYENTSLIDIRKYSQVEDSSESLFDYIVVIENYPIDEQINEKNGLLRINSYSMFEMTNFDLALSIAGDEELEIKFIYNNSVFDNTDIENMADYFVNIIEEISIVCKQNICNINMISNLERNKVINEYNSLEVDYPIHKNICELFQEQVDKNPLSKAVEYKSDSISYIDLNNKSNQLARMLIKKGIKNDDVVGVIGEKSIDFIISIMGILKSGAAYLPIEQNYPKERIEYMLLDSKAKIILVDKNVDTDFKNNGEIFYMNDYINYKEEDSNLIIDIPSSSLAYVIYTSGSTGNPKGVMIEHKSLINFLYSMNSSFNNAISSTDSCLSITSICFDVSVCEIFLPLVFGAKLVLFQNERIPDIVELSEVIVNKEITFTYIPPTLLREVCECLKEKGNISLNKMLVGVEPIKDYVLKEYTNLNNSIEIINGYGPTEATICTTFYKYVDKESEGKNIPIGRPISNTQVYVVDKYFNPTAIGVPGELCISGNGLARGYLNNTTLTKEKFIDNHFNNGTILYRTGDIAKWTSDGNIQFVGRVDYQVKVRGHRIELKEIEYRLLEINGIREAVVIDRKDGENSKYICAYIVCDIDYSPKEIRNHLILNLPGYMIPSYFIKIDRIPVTSNGKIDRRALNEIKIDFNLNEEYEMPRDEIENKLVQIWNEVLNIEKVGISNNFFELGGHSLKATMLAARIHKEMDVKISVGKVLELPTIKEMAQYISNSKKEKYFSIQPVEESDYYELSSSQKRIYIVNKVNLNSLEYNMIGGLILEGNLDVQRLDTAFKQLVNRHEILRTYFEFKDGEPVQAIKKDITFNINFSKLLNEDIDEEGKIKKLFKRFIKPFDLTKAPLLSVELVQLYEERYILLFDMHHIVSDGLSVDVLIKEILDLYQGKELETLRIQYKDYSLWHNNFLKSDYVKKQEQYWINKLDNFKYTMIERNNQVNFLSHEGGSEVIKMQGELLKKIQSFCISRNITKFNFMLTVFNIIISKEVGQKDISIAIPISGRRNPDLEKLIGVFLNVLIIRTKIQERMSFKDYLIMVKDTVLEAQDNQDYPYEQLNLNIQKQQKLYLKGLFSIMFNYMPYNGKDTMDFENITVTQCDTGRTDSKYDITLYLREKVESIELNLVYNKNLYEDYLIKRIMNNFIRTIESIMENEDIYIDDIYLEDNTLLENNYVNMANCFDNDDMIFD